MVVLPAELVVPLDVVLNPYVPVSSLRYLLVGLSRPRWTAAELRAVLGTKPGVTFKHLAVLRDLGYATVTNGKTPDARWTFAVPSK